MKYALLLIVLATVALWRIGGENTSSPLSPPDTSFVSPTGTPTHALPAVTFKNQEFSYALARLDAGTRLTLLPNFPAPQSFAAVVEKNTCSAAINGGFYDQGYTSLGWFVANGETLTAARPSALFNAYLTVSADGETRIGQASTPAHYGLQAGPLLFWDGQELPLRIREDEPARRSVIATSSTGRTILLSVFSSDQVFEGPYLADLPAVLSRINQKESLAITSAMNLDGGSASAFFSGDAAVGELTYVGSVLCANNL